MPLSFTIGVLGRLLSPIVCLFVERKPRFDTVKRLGKKKVLLERDNLVWWLSWFGIQSPELFVDVFPWLKNDEYENVK